MKDKFPSILCTLLAVVGFGAVAMIFNISLSSCVTSGETFTYANSAGVSVTITGFGAWCENNLTVIRAATKNSILITSKALNTKGISTTKIAGYIKSSEAVLQPLLDQSSVSQADIDSSLATVSVSDPDGIYATAIEPAIDLVAGYIVELKNEGAPTKVTVDVTTALLNGLSDAASQLSPTASLKVHTEIRAPFGCKKHESIYDLSVTKN